MPRKPNLSAASRRVLYQLVMAWANHYPDASKRADYGRARARMLKLENQVRKLKTQRDKAKIQAGRYASQVLDLENEMQRAAEPV